MPVNPSNPPNQITNPNAAIPVYIAGGGSYSSVNSQVSVPFPWDWDSTGFSMQAITAQNVALQISADSGNPTDGQQNIFRIQDAGSPVQIILAQGSPKSFEIIGVTVPDVTVANKILYIGCIYNANRVRWDVVAVSVEA